LNTPTPVYNKIYILLPGSEPKSQNKY
jgi:hypothetical protein